MKYLGENSLTHLIEKIKENGVTDYNDLTNKPTNISSFTNDAGYVDEEYVANAIAEAITGALEGSY